MSDVRQPPATMQRDQLTSQSRPPRMPWRSVGLFVVRYGIGGVMILAGIVSLLAVGGEVGAHGFSMGIGAGLAVMLLNLLYRMSVTSDRDRAREEEARLYFDEHGDWPDDEEPQRRFRVRRWTLPPGAVSAEEEEREGRFGDGGRVAGTVPETR